MIMKRHTTEEIGVHRADEMARDGKSQRELARRLHELEVENTRLRLLLIELILEKDRLEEQLFIPNRNLLKQAR